MNINDIKSKIKKADSHTPFYPLSGDDLDELVGLATMANKLLSVAYFSVEDRDFRNEIDTFLGRKQSNKTAVVTLNEKQIDLQTCHPTGADVRAKLPPDQSGYSLWRDTRTPEPDQPVSDTMLIFDGDTLYSIPPCHGA